MQTPFDLAAPQWFFAILAAACVGISKSGFGAMAIPGILLMTQVMPARESTGVILPMLILADLFAVRAFRQFTVWRLLLKILPATVLGVIAGWWLMPRIPTGFFTPVIGWIILALLLLTILQKCFSPLQKFAADHPAVVWPLGFLAGVSTMLANAAGPAMTVYLLASRLPKYEFVGTAAWFFFFINLVKIPFSASLGLITSQTLLFNLLLAPAVVLGLLCGRFLLGKINQQAFEWLLIGLSFFGALKLVCS
ncbi:MAG: sulfite exporter TauE/SafE family protein [bacterium]